MTKLEQLIKELCPDGVEYKTLGELGKFYGGLSGKNKNDFKNGNSKFITYMNVFSNIALNLDVTDTVKINEGEKQNTIHYGDVLFTGSSETPDECGMSSVLTINTEEKLYLNSFCFIYRFNNSKLFLPAFSKYLFRSELLRKQIIKTASGVTRFNVSKAKMAKVQIPVPPLEVQREIVRILDNFTELTQELTQELTLRKKQYSYYRDYLLDFGDNVEWKTLGEIATGFYRGWGIKRDELTENGTPCIRYGEIYTTYGIHFDKCVSYTDENNIKSKKYMEYGDILFAITGESVEDIAKSTVYIGKEKCLVGGDIVVMKHNQNPKYLSYALSTTDARIQKSKGKIKSKVVHASLESIKQIKIPVPPIEEQERIVKILDKFDTLCNDLTHGIPAEISARQKQYEYYRDKLLSFEIK